MPLIAKNTIRSWFLIVLALSSGSVYSRDLKIIFSQYTPPYVFEQGNGIVIDIVKAALEPAGYRILPVYLPMSRGVELFAEKRVDGTAIIREDSGLKANYSDNFMEYHNRAVALKSRKLTLSSFKDFGNLTVVGFQNAHKYLGEEFGRAVAGNPNYKEMADQETQTLMLLLGRIDVAVMDESVFRFYREKLITEGKASRSVECDIFPLFQSTPYKTAFVDASVRDDFNRGLAAMRRDGRYQAIYHQYMEHYFVVKQ